MPAPEKRPTRAKDRPVPEKKLKRPEVTKAARSSAATKKVKEKEWAGNERFGLAHPGTQAKARKTELIKSMIEPRTEELVAAMVDIALNREIDKDGNIKPLGIHPSIRLEAQTRLLERAYGKPKEHIQHEDITETADTDDVTRLLNSILEQVGAPQLAPDTPALPSSQDPG